MFEGREPGWLSELPDALRLSGLQNTFSPAQAG